MGKAQEVLIEGKIFKSISSACKYYGISPQQLQSRIKKGQSIQDALLSVKLPSSRQVMINNIIFTNRTEACKYYGTDRDIIYSRLKLGWSLEKAIVTPTRKGKL